MNIFKKKSTSTEDNREARQMEDGNAALACILNEFQLEGSATSLSTFYSAMELISNSVARMPIIIKRDNVKDITHPLNIVFRDALISKFMFMKMLVTDVILHGNAYAYIERTKDGTPSNLVYCEYGSVNLYYNQHRQEIYYQVPFLKKGRIEPCNMIHLYKNSNDGVNGKSLVSYANSTIKLSKSTDKAASKYYSSGCALQGALTIKGSRRNSKEQARQAFTDAHGSNGSGLVILDDDMTYTPISSNANDSQMIEARTFNVQEVARYFNINPLLLGDTAGATFTSIEMANIEFCTRTLQPYVSMIEEEFNRKLIKPSEVNVTIDLDESILMKGDMNTKANYYKTLTESGILSINEARAELGYNSVDGGDKHNIAYSKIEDNTIK